MENRDQKKEVEKVIVIGLDRDVAEIFQLILHIRDQMKENRGREIALDEAIATYMNSKKMAGENFMEFRCIKCGK